MPTFVVAVEYLGADLPPHRGANRRPICEHAYDLDTGTFAHGDDTTRVGFEQPTRGWPRAPHAARCDRCTRAVADLVADLVRHAITQLTPPTGPPGRGHHETATVILRLYHGPGHS